LNNLLAIGFVFLVVPRYLIICDIILRSVLGLQGFSLVLLVDGGQLLHVTYQLIFTPALLAM
jgi:hypothetical protein